MPHYFEKERAREVGNATLNRGLSVLSNMFTFAWRKELIPVNPMLGYGKLPVDETVVRILEPAESLSEGGGAKVESRQYGKRPVYTVLIIRNFEESSSGRNLVPQPSDHTCDPQKQERICGDTVPHDFRLHRPCTAFNNHNERHAEGFDHVIITNQLGILRIIRTVRNRKEREDSK
jgi:hypothetical protein